MEMLTVMRSILVNLILASNWKLAVHGFNTKTNIVFAGFNLSWWTLSEVFNFAPSLIKFIAGFILIGDSY